MLTIDNSRHHGHWRGIAVIVGIIVILLSVYISALYFAPALSLGLYKKPFTIQSVAAPSSTQNRLIIPKIGLDITYAKPPTPSKQVAEWHQLEATTPKDGAITMLAAYRFNLESTPVATIDNSPFYNIDKLTSGDTVFVDYDAIRYAYKVVQSSTYDGVKPVVTEQTTPTLTLYTLGEGKTCYVVTAEKLGQVK